MSEGLAGMPPGRLTRIAWFDVPGVVEGVHDGALDAEDFHDFLARKYGATPVVSQAHADGDLGVGAVARGGYHTRR